MGAGRNYQRHVARDAEPNAKLPGESLVSAVRLVKFHIPGDLDLGRPHPECHQTLGVKIGLH